MRTTPTRTSARTHVISTTVLPIPWHPSRPGLERAHRLDPLGERGPTKGQSQTAAWRAVGPGWFRPAGAPASVEQRIVEASYRAPAGGGVTGWAALRWQGGRWFDGTAPDGARLDVPVTMITSHRSHTPGVRYTKERLRPDEVVEIDGLRVTTATRSVLYEARHAPCLADAVVAMDMACFNDLVSLAELGRAVDGSKAWTGIQQARDALSLASENAWSPAEVAFRLLWTEVGELGPVVCNAPVFDLHGRHLLTPDLFDPVSGVVGEYQGAHHFERSQRRRDITRETLLRDHGLEYVERVAGEEPTRFLIRLRSAYARAARMPAADRRFTLTPPPSWTATETVAQRRALPPHLRASLLAHRTLDHAA
jgi:hypothetical protein